jgi:hypothetical protein
MLLTPLLPLPPSFVSDILANSAQILIDWSPYITLILGVLVAALALGIIIDHLRR